MKLVAQQVGEWVPTGSGIEVPEARIRLFRGDAGCRLILIRHRVPERGKPQSKRLFTRANRRHQAIVTSFFSMEVDAAEVHRSCLPRGEFENRIKDAGGEARAHRLLSRRLQCPEALLRTPCFTCNLVRLFQDGLGLRPADRPRKEWAR